jgi:hypothetical protein
MVVCSATQCHIYSTANWNTPHIFDLKEPAQLVLQCSRGFALVDAVGAAQVGDRVVLKLPMHRKVGMAAGCCQHKILILLKHQS